jgi:sporulation protein YlmC with PRC-barrel domain
VDIQPGETVISSDGQEVGKVARVVISPVTRSIESLVVERGALFSDARVVPIRMVHKGTDEGILLNLNSEALRSLPIYREAHFIDSLAPSKRGAESAAQYYLRPVDVLEEGDLLPNYPAPPIVEAEVENIPPGTVALEEGTEVRDEFGEHVGKVEQILVKPKTQRATHVVLSRGRVIETEKLIPADWIRYIKEGQVELGVSLELIRRLPEYSG